MSALQLFRPEESTSTVGFARDREPEVLPFRLARRMSSYATVDRARRFHSNRECPTCRHPAVSPVELRDAALNRNGMPIPGTATLVGFHCDRCEYEWPA